MSFKRLLLACPICGSFVVGELELCPYCERTMYKWLSAKSVYEWRQDLKSLSLFKWEPSNRFLSKWLYSLKGNSRGEAYLFWASELLNRRLSFGSLPSKESVGLVPAPAADKKDHAYGLASAFEQMGAGRLQNVLLRGHKARAQKSKNVDERKNMKLSIRSGWNCHSYKSVIFVDDVITSGATAQAAWEALGRPKSYEIWTLADRPALRDSGGFAILPP